MLVNTFMEFVIGYLFLFKESLSIYATFGLDNVNK